MRSIWKGSLSFGLVNISISVYSAIEEHALDLDMLHAHDLSPIRYARMCKLEEKEVPYNEIVKGYEYEKGEYIVIEDKDFEAAYAEKTKTIDIQSFAFLDEIDPIFFNKSYYLEPDKKAVKAYELFLTSLAKSKKVALATFVFRNKEHIGIIRPYDTCLVLTQMRYFNEIRHYQELHLPKGEKFTKAEIEMALKLIDQLSYPFDPKKYEDTYTEELMHVISDKLEGKKPSRKSKEPKHTSASDLMQQLKASLQKTLQSTPTKKPPTVIKSPPKKSKAPKKGK